MRRKIVERLFTILSITIFAVIVPNCMWKIVHIEVFGIISIIGLLCWILTVPVLIHRIDDDKWHEGK